MKYQDYHRRASAAILGLCLQPDEQTRIGITYLTPVDLNFSAVPHLEELIAVMTLLGRRGFLGSSVDLGLTVPQEVMVGVYRKVTDRLALLGSTNWQNWSQFGEVGIGINSSNPKNLTQNLNYQDTWQVAVGAQYKVSPAWLLSAGFAFDSPMVSNSNRTVSAPVRSRPLRHGRTIQMERAPHDRPCVRVLLDGKPASDPDQGIDKYHRVGQFTNTLANFFGLNLVYVF